MRRQMQFTMSADDARCRGGSHLWDIGLGETRSEIMARIKVAIACQGGGSQTAFTAGALKELIGVHDRLKEEFRFVSLSGTSGGSLCAALVWYSFMKGERPFSKRLMDFWHENTAHDWLEEAFNDFIVRYLRTINSGLLPAFQFSPSSPLLTSMMSGISAFMRRKEFMDFPALLRKYIDFEEIASWGPRPQPPVLVVGAANVSTGSLVKFSSAHQSIRLEQLLASCCVPTIFPPVMIDEHAYWDGLFSDNPPIDELVRPRTVGMDNVPEEIWLIKINPTARRRVPRQPADIIDRHNQLAGNISLFQQLKQLELLNDMLVADVFRPEFLAQMDIKAPIRIPKSLTCPDRPYHIPCIEMPDEVQEKLDYEGKIDRSAKNIDGLIAIGEASAREFLKKRAAAVAASSSEAGKAATAALKDYLWRGAKPRRGDKRAGRRP